MRNACISQVIRWSHDLSEGIKFIHGLAPKIIHRDIKPDNVLLDMRLNCEFSWAPRPRAHLFSSARSELFSRAPLSLGSTSRRRRFCLFCAFTVAYWNCAHPRVPCAGKLADFGLSKALDREIRTSKRSVCAPLLQVVVGRPWLLDWMVCFVRD